MVCLLDYFESEDIYDLLSCVLDFIVCYLRYFLS